uniref:Ohp1 n=1 Tax=Arundo donax TaxID=35708 RepID=A0A0A9FP11_ARUDO
MPLPAAAPGLGLSSTASSRNFWKYHSDGHRFIAPAPSPAAPLIPAPDPPPPPPPGAATAPVVGA